jgi:hypothetical protein
MATGNPFARRDHRRRILFHSLMLMLLRQNLSSFMSETDAQRTGQINLLRPPPRSRGCPIITSVH